MADRKINWLQTFAAVMLFVALLCGSFGYFVASRLALMNAWPETPGKVIAADVTLKPMRSSTNGSGGTLHSHWTLVVQYSYEVGGKSYLGDRSSSRWIMKPTEGGSLPPDWLVHKQRNYPPGMQVIVHYNPVRPGASVLEIDNSQPKFLFIIATATLVFSAVLYLYGILKTGE